MLAKYLSGIPWGSATVQASLGALVATWVAFLTKAPLDTVDGKPQTVSLQFALSATFAAAAFIYQRRATASATKPVTL